MFRLFNIRIAQRFDYELTAEMNGTNSHNNTETLTNSDDNKSLNHYGIQQQQQWTITLKHILVGNQMPLTVTMTRTLQRH